LNGCYKEKREEKSWAEFKMEKLQKSDFLPDKITVFGQKLFFLPGIVFFWVNNPREINEFVSTTVVLPLRTLTMNHRL
jgi:hypothetical protein